MIYILKVNLELPKLNYVYRDGDYLKYLRNTLGIDEFKLLDTEIKKLRKDNIRYFSRVYSKSSCENEYITFEDEDRKIIKATIEKFFNNERFKVAFIEEDKDYSIKEYIFLQ